MRNYKVKTTVLKDFNDSKNNGKTYEKDEPITLERARYEELLSKGFVKVGEEIKTEEDKFSSKTDIKKFDEELILNAEDITIGV